MAEFDLLQDWFSLFVSPDLPKSTVKIHGVGNYAITLQCCLLLILLPSILPGAVPRPTLANHRG